MKFSKSFPLESLIVVVARVAPGHLSLQILLLLSLHMFLRWLSLSDSRKAVVYSAILISLIVNGGEGSGSVWINRSLSDRIWLKAIWSIRLTLVTGLRHLIGGGSLGSTVCHAKLIWLADFHLFGLDLLKLLSSFLDSSFVHGDLWVHLIQLGYLAVDGHSAWVVSSLITFDFDTSTTTE